MDFIHSPPLQKRPIIESNLGIQQHAHIRSRPKPPFFITLFSCCDHFPSQGSLFRPSIHGYARKIGLDVRNVKVGTTLIDMYAKFGEIGLARLSFDHILCVGKKVSWNTMIDGYMRNRFEEAVKLFYKMPGRDAVCWTLLIHGFVKKGKFEEALGWFQEMQLAGADPGFVTVVSVFSVANIGTRD